MQGSRAYDILHRTVHFASAHPFCLPQVRLADLEKGLLEALATAEGDLLEDTSLIERLSETKATAAEIQVDEWVH